MGRPYPLGAGAAELAEGLSGAGVPAYVDPRDLNPPCAWIEPTAVSTDTLDAVTLAVTWNVYLIAPGGLDVPGQLDALGQLLADAVLFLGPVEAAPVGIALPNLSPEPMPALRITLETDLTPTEE